MKVIIDGTEYIPKPEELKPESLKLQAKTDEEALRLYYAFEPLCPECGNASFPTNFPAESVGGEKEDKRIVWFCSDMGHCAFAIDESIKWRQKTKK